MGAIYTKPGPGTQLDWTSPFTRNLVTCLPLWERTGRTLVDVANGGNNALLNWDATWDGSPYGPSVTYDGGRGHWATIGSGNPSNIAIGIGSPHTLAVVFQVTGFSGFGIVPGLLIQEEISSARMGGLELYDIASGSSVAKLRCEIFDGSGGPAIQDTVDLLGTGWHSGVMTLDNTLATPTMALYRDGILVGTTSYSNTTIDQAGTGWYLGARPDQYGGANIGGVGGVGFTGGIALAMIASRAWSAEEVRAWAGNPWQIFQSSIPWYLTLRSSAPTIATLTGPTSGLVGSPSTSFTVTLDAPAGAGGVVITPASTGGTDTFS